MADLVIRNATIVDGTGAPATTGDLAVEGERIVAVGDCSEVSTSGARVIDADGLSQRRDVLLEAPGEGAVVLHGEHGQRGGGNLQPRAGGLRRAAGAGEDEQQGEDERSAHAELCTLTRVRVNV